MGFRNRRKRRDANHTAVQNEVETMGYPCVDLSQVGGGCPDMLVSGHGKTYLVEIKNREGRDRISSGQTDFAASWRGQIIVAYDSLDVVAAIAKDNRGGVDNG